MRHIKIYEEYSDEELQDLIGDLKSVGQTPFKPKLGKDYGWTSKMLEKSPDPKSVFGVYFTPETVNYMVEKGMAYYFGFRDKEKEVDFESGKGWDSSYGSYGPGNYKMNLRLQRVGFSEKTLYQLIGISGDFGFGAFGTKSVGKKARNHCQDQFVEKFKKYVEEKGHL